jgi:hypothetical protein
MDEVTREMHRLSEEALPLRAEGTGDYPVRHDHCFKRIAFDAAVGDKWDRVIDRPFYQNASPKTKRAAVSVLKEMLRSPEAAESYNRQSLHYR